MINVHRILDGDIALFRASLDRQGSLEHLLSRAELGRAARFRFPIDRRRYIAGRGLLRALLAERASVDPAELEIAVGPHGKPRLASHHHVTFNVSHSGDLALFAFTSGCEVGVDVEHLRAVDPIRLSETCFSEREQTELLHLAPHRRLGAFFDGWVRKEAVVKADGRGLAMPLDSFSVPLVGSPKLSFARPQDPILEWELHAVTVGQSARAAVALRR